MRTLKQVSILMDEFVMPSPAQQLLDRFLMGYREEGMMRRTSELSIRAWAQHNSVAQPLLDRARDWSLKVITSIEEAMEGPDGIVIVPKGDGAHPNESVIERSLRTAPAGLPIFVYGRLANSHSRAQEFAQIAASRGILLSAGTVLPTTFRLPDLDVPMGSRLEEALIVVQGTFPSAELAALDGLLPVLERRKGGERGVRQLHYFDGNSVWRAGDEGQWSWALLASALSRSHTPQGNAVLDGRTEDLVGLGLVQKLAANPRAWILEHQDRLRTAILVLDGVVTDYNFAVKARNGMVTSAQLFRAPSPQEEHYSRLMAALMRFFTTGTTTWPMARAITEARLIEEMSHKR